jgi:hypothetical protein
MITQRLRVYPLPALGSLVLATGLAVGASGSAMAATPSTIDLGTAAAASVIAGSGVTNTGSSILALDLDTAPTPAISGFPPGISGPQHADDGVAQTAQADLTTAYNAAASAPSTNDETGVDLGGQVLTQGVYTASSDMSLTGPVPLTLNGSASSVFIFQAGTTLITGSDSSVVLTGGVLACNVFWQVGTSATLGTGTEFQGNILALTSISVDANATIAGRALARNGEVSLIDDTFTAPSCDTTTTPTPTTTAPPTTAAPPVTTAPTTTAVPVGTETPAPSSPTTPVTVTPIHSTTTPVTTSTATTLGPHAVGTTSVGGGGGGGGGGATLLTPSPSTTLASTGLNTRPLLALGAGGAMTGAALVLTARRRRTNA